MATRACSDKRLNVLSFFLSVAPSKLLTPAGAQPSKRVQVDEDTSLTLGAASVFGLTVVVGAFLVVSALTSSDVAADVAATAKQTTQEAARKLPPVPKPLPVSLPGAASPDSTLPLLPTAGLHVRSFLIYLKYWALNLNTLMVYPEVQFPPNLIINPFSLASPEQGQPIHKVLQSRRL